MLARMDMDTNPWDLAPCVARLNAFRDARDWARFHVPRQLAAALAIEAAELQETLLWKSDAEAAAALDDPSFRAKWEEEIADVAVCLLMCAERTGVDLRAAVDRKIDANERRYTVEEHRGVARKAPPVPPSSND